MRNYITLDINNKNKDSVYSLLVQLGVNPYNFYVDIDRSSLVDIVDLIRIKTKKLYIKRLFNNDYILVATMNVSKECKLTLNYLNYLYSSEKSSKNFQSVENISNFDVSRAKSLDKFSNYMSNVIGVELSSIYDQATPEKDTNLDWETIFSNGKLDFTNFYTERVTIFEDVYYFIVAYKETDGTILMNSYFIESFTYLSRLDSFQGSELPYDIIKNETLKSQNFNKNKKKLNVDAILEKITFSGISSLTNEEKTFLTNGE